jgi:hypothetical protein
MRDHKKKTTKNQCNEKLAFWKYKFLANLTERKREKNQINKSRDEKGDIITNTDEIQ